MRFIIHCLLLILVSTALSASNFQSVSWLPTERTEGNAIVSVDDSASATLSIARHELEQCWRGLPVTLSVNRDGSDGDGFVITSDSSGINITSASDVGVLYGVYDLLRTPVNPGESRRSSPAFGRRILNHWDNLDGTVERGYAGRSLWKWDELPDSISPRYEEYARANAAVGINGAVLNNVNASPRILSAESLASVAKLADIFRPYGIRVYLSVNFASPMALGKLTTADPLDPAVSEWWRAKVGEIYSLIPDFGGFLVKANSEGQPGPMDFGRTHADGANMLARALAPHGGIVIWRSFVYSPSGDDRAMQASNEFVPLDGAFDPNVIIQIKNGPIDFQPREPYSPLFTSIPRTKRMVEFQITQEYLGQANHLAFLAPLWSEFFSYVSPDSLSAVAGVANIGDGEMWTGHPLAQANWYAFGRMAWDPTLSPRQIATEWIDRCLLDSASTPQDIRDALVDMFVGSREAVVDYMMPLGLHHIFAYGHHYGPEPWCDVPGARADWLPKYYHRADTVGLGFDRTASGSGAIEQYPEPFRSLVASPETCPDEFLLWFHHIPWTWRMKSGQTLWDELCHRYQRGVDTVAGYQRIWEKAKPFIRPALHADVTRRLVTQHRDAQWWRDACLQYFATFSRLPLPTGVEPPLDPLDRLQSIKLPISNHESPSASLLDTLRP